MPTPRNGYYLKDGTRVPGTTTVIGRFKESGALLRWAFQQGKDGKNDLYEDRDKAASFGLQLKRLYPGTPEYQQYLSEQ